LEKYIEKENNSIIEYAKIDQTFSSITVDEISRWIMGYIKK
jgi:hypothetical protein